MKFRAFFRPVAMTQSSTIISQACQVDNHDTSLLPDHLPEISNCVREWALGRNVRWISWIMVGLHKKIPICKIFGHIENPQKPS